MYPCIARIWTLTLSEKSRRATNGAPAHTRGAKPKMSTVERWHQAAAKVWIEDGRSTRYERLLFYHHHRCRHHLHRRLRHHYRYHYYYHHHHHHQQQHHHQKGVVANIAEK